MFALLRRETLARHPLAQAVPLPLFDCMPLAGCSLAQALTLASPFKYALVFGAAAFNLIFGNIGDTRHLEE